MAASLITPIEEVTGIPYPLYPSRELPPVPVGRARNIERIADWHHPFHPRQELIHGNLGDVAVRHCRIQWAEYNDHHHRYHGAFIGPALPEEPVDQFRTVVLAVAGYVPQQAIGFDSRSRPIIKEICDSERKMLWDGRQIRVANLATARDFMLNYTLTRDFSDINLGTIDEFLHTTNLNRKKELGGTLLAIAAYQAAEPMENLYRSLRRSHLLPEGYARTAGRFVFGTMNVYRRSRAIAALTNKLAA